MLLLVIAVSFFVKKSVSGGNSESVVKTSENDISQSIRYHVEKGEITRSLTLSGTVINTNPDELVLITGEKGDDTETVLVTEGQEVTKGTVLFTIGGLEYCAPADGKLVKLEVSEDAVTAGILDYSRLSIYTEVNYAYLDILSVGATVTVKETNPLSEGKKSTETVTGFGYYVTDNNVEMQLTNSGHFLPGTTFTVEYNYTEYCENCYILKRMLQEDLDGTYVYVLTEDYEWERRSVVVGDTFTEYNGEVGTDFVEILSGLEEGETVITEWDGE